MRKVAIYCRVSTEEQARVEEGSIKNQAEILSKYIDAENMKEGKWGTLVDIYKDEGYSAKSLNRPELKRLLLDISKRRVNTVLLTEISRMSRSVRDWIDLRTFFSEHDATFIATRQKFDTSTAMGRAMLDFAIQFSQLEREMTVERVKASYHARVSRGLWPGGPIPYGLDKTERPGHLHVNAAKQIIANEILDILTERAGYVAKALELIREAGYTREGGVAWDENSLCRWVRNRALIGELEINEKSRGRDETNLPEAERFKIVPAVWGPIVDRKKWERANALLDRNYKMLKLPQWKHNEFLLTGMIRCPKGVMLTGASGHGRSGDKYPYYRHQRKCSCHFASIPAEDLEKVVLRKIREVAASEEVVRGLIARANEDFKKTQPNFREATLTAKRRLEGLATQLDKVTNEILAAPSPEDKRVWTDKAHRLQAEKDGVERELQALEKNRGEASDGMLEEETVVKALARFREEFDTLPFPARQSLITSLLHSVDVEKDELVLNLKNPGFRWQKKAPVHALLGCESGDQNLDERSKWGNARSGDPQNVPQALIPLRTPFSSYPWFKDKGFLAQEYLERQKSLAQIARELGCARSTVLKYLLEAGVEPRRDGLLPNYRKSQLAYGEKIRNGQAVPHLGEIGVIRQFVDLRGQGLSYEKLATWANRERIPTKNRTGRWDRRTIFEIIKRSQHKVDNAAKPLTPHSTLLEQHGKRSLPGLARPPTDPGA